MEKEAVDEQVYNINLFAVDVVEGVSPPEGNYKVQVMINNHLDHVLADTGANVSVCGKDLARKWDLLDRKCETRVKIKPYKSEVIPTMGVSTCGVTFGDRTVPVR